MDFSFSAEQQAIRSAIERICARFGDDYWLAKDKAGGFPHDFHRAFADDGWLGICIPQEYGGAGLGVTEAAIMMQAIAESGAGMSGASALHMNIFGLNPVVVFGNDEQKRRMLPPLIAGQDKACFAVTEPNVGLDTLKLKTKAVRDGNDRYLLSGQKIWISTAQVATKMLILARTTPLEQVKRRTEGLSLFYTDFDRKHIDAREIPKMGRSAVDSNELFIDNLPVPMADRIGEEGKGFEYILHGMNPERILIGAEAVGLGRAALRKAPQLRQRAHRVRPADRAEPGDPASAGEVLDGARGGEPDGVQGGLALRPRRALRHRGQRGEISGRRSGVQGLRDRADDPWRHGLRQGIPRRALSARGADRAHRAGVAADDPELHRRAGARPAEIVLIAECTYDQSAPHRSCHVRDARSPKLIDYHTHVTGLALVGRDADHAFFATRTGQSRSNCAAPRRRDAPSSAFEVAPARNSTTLRAGSPSLASRASEERFGARPRQGARLRGPEGHRDRAVQRVAVGRPQPVSDRHRRAQARPHRVLIDDPKAIADFYARVLGFRVRTGSTTFSSSCAATPTTTP